MRDLTRELHERVKQRANNRCEYCGLSQASQEATFHIDHVFPRAAGGTSDFQNLALACVSCSLRKSSRLTAIDPQTGEEAAIFNPRLQLWSDHFEWDEELLVPLTSIGRATVLAMSMNRPLILAIRIEEIERGRHPPW